MGIGRGIFWPATSGEVLVSRSERNTLDRVENTLPRDFYLSPDHYRRELAAIWYESWVYACRSEEVSESRDFHFKDYPLYRVAVAEWADTY
jgi:hypothetical protein